MRRNPVAGSAIAFPSCSLLVRGRGNGTSRAPRGVISLPRMAGGRRRFSVARQRAPGGTIEVKA